MELRTLSVPQEYRLGCKRYGPIVPPTRKAHPKDRLSIFEFYEKKELRGRVQISKNEIVSLLCQQMCQIVQALSGQRGNRVENNFELRRESVYNLKNGLAHLLLSLGGREFFLDSQERGESD